MNRYDHALNKSPEEVHKNIERIQSFGFDNEIDDIDRKLLRRRKRYPYFKLEPQQAARVGIVFEDPKIVFAGTHVHFHKRYFLCKSIPPDDMGRGMQAPCCEKLKNRIFRAACILIIYTGNKKRMHLCESYEVIPWCFGKAVYNKLKALHDTFPIHSHDFMVRRTSDRLNIYDIMPCPENSFWQNSKEKESIIAEAERFRANIKDIIGDDLSIEEINELLKNYPVIRGK